MREKEQMKPVYPLLMKEIKCVLSLSSETKEAACVSNILMFTTVDLNTEILQKKIVNETDTCVDYLMQQTDACWSYCIYYVHHCSGVQFSCTTHNGSACVSYELLYKKLHLSRNRQINLSFPHKPQPLHTLLLF